MNNSFEDDFCGQAILQLVSRANAIIAEILRLKSYVPSAFRMKTKHHEIQYKDIIMDFGYLKSLDSFEAKIEKNETLRQFDEKFRETHLETLSRFYVVFENIHTYATHLNHFVEELEDGVYMQQSLDTVFLDVEGKQLMCEALYLYGIMLLMVDIHIEGVVRERLLISYIRYSGQRTDLNSNVDDVCKLLRSTGYGLNNGNSCKRASNYPENYFSRVAVHKKYVHMVLSKLSTDDIYSQNKAYPSSEYKSVALSNQASMVYVCLFFDPEILHNQTTKMRGIVDKFFPDNWVISIYMGLTINLIDSWEPYKSARLALNNTIEPSNVKEISRKMGEKMNILIEKVENRLQETSLTHLNRPLSNLHKIEELIRDSNLCLRWLMLHTTTASVQFEQSKKARSVSEMIQLATNCSSQKLFRMLLVTSEYEFKIKEKIKHQLETKETTWMELKKHANMNLLELANVFSGHTSLPQVEKNIDLEKWFRKTTKEIDELTEKKEKKILQLIDALRNVQDYHHLDANLQVKQFLLDACTDLRQMIDLVYVNEDVLVNIQIFTDLSYAWCIIDQFTHIMQDGIQQDPALVIQLRASFLKLTSALDIPLLRINQARSADLVSVSQYYSTQLVNYIKQVLQIIPERLFEILAKIIDLQTNVIKELPTQIEKANLKEYAQFDYRFQVAKNTYAISLLTEGILRMDTTLVGVISIEPRKILEEGIRRELIRNLGVALNNTLSFQSKSKTSELTPKLEQLYTIMDGYRRSFEYIQDYISVNGLKLLQEELNRLLNHAVDQECSLLNSGSYLKTWKSDSAYDLTLYPLLPSSCDSSCANFMGSFAREILKVTDPRTTVYLQSTVGWHDIKTRKQIVNIPFFNKILESLGPNGLKCLDTFYGHMIVQNLQKIMSHIQSTIFKEKTRLNHLIFDETDLPAVSKCQKLLSSSILYMFHPLIIIGQLQLIRKHIAFELHRASRVDSYDLHMALTTLNNSLLANIKLANEQSMPDNEFLFIVSSNLEHMGIHEPFEKVYVPTENNKHYSQLMFLFVLSQLVKISYSKEIDDFLPKKNEQIDANPLIAGIYTFFKQFDDTSHDNFFRISSKFILENFNSNLKIKNGELSNIAASFLQFLEAYISLTKCGLELCDYIPQIILDHYVFLGNKHT